MRKIAASYLLTPDNDIVKNGVVTCDDDGTIVEAEWGAKFSKEEAGVEFYSGLLTPGFVNAHCHLELSYMKGKIDEKTGIGGFIGQVNRIRNNRPGNVQKYFQQADRKMWVNGIAAVGDISNSSETVEVKRQSKIFYHTFIEAFGFHPSRAERAFALAKEAKQQFEANGLACSIVPHSPYSVSDPLFQMIKTEAKESKSILSIHNQESNGENQFFLTGDGPIADHLSNNLNIDISHWKPTGRHSLESVIGYFPAENILLLVHNTFTQNEDLVALEKKRMPQNNYFVLCPNSNLYIENSLSPVSLLKDKKLNICIGTDSLASNQGLSILSELVTLQHHFPSVRLEELFTWSCINGAKALGISEVFGSLEIGKKPGINIISGIDFLNMKLNASARVQRLC